MDKASIVIAEDEQDIRDLIHFNLLKEDYRVYPTVDGEEALETIKRIKPDLAILDVMMPKLDGISVCKMLREDSTLDDTSIIMLTAKGTEEDVILGLESGADDYIVKPFSTAVLKARVKVFLRKKFKKNIEDSTFIKIHGIDVDLEKRKISLEGEPLNLSFSEFELICLLASKPGKVFTRSQIVDQIRGENHAITDRSVDVHIVGLRKKMNEKGNLIETVRGVGYRFKE